MRLPSSVVSLSASSALAFLVSTGDGVAQEPAPAPETARPWTVLCGEAAGADEAISDTGGSRCVLRQRLVQSEGGAQVLFVGVRPEEDGGAAIRLVVPLGIDVPAGVTLRVDGEPLATVPVQTCLPAGCTALAIVDAGAVERLKAGTRMGVAVRALGGRAIAWPASLSGFTAAFDEALAGSPDP